VGKAEQPMQRETNGTGTIGTGIQAPGQEPYLGGIDSVTSPSLFCFRVWGRVCMHASVQGRARDSEQDETC
jgi:hypothetical protein